jgi:GNAT superfamily N-acetyltransferase
MADVDRLFLASRVRVEITEPRDIDARYCLRSYFEELGHRLGRRLLERLSAEAASRGMVILRLETNRSLFEAKHLYERAGFVEVEPFNNEPYAH